MDWKFLKSNLYDFDGSWLDIYVQGTTENDWRKWVNLVNEKYPVTFFTEPTKDQIDFQTVLDYWKRKTDLPRGATIRLADTQVKCHFFDTGEIENDFDPREIKSIEDHERLLEYLRSVSTALNKRVILTPENTPEVVLVECENEKIKITVPNTK